MRQLWDNPDRGRVPTNWTISPALWDAAPTILRYYRETATANDVLIAGPSGLGYVYPTPWPDDTFHRFTEMTGRYMDRTGIDIVWVFNMANERPAEISQVDAQAYVDDVHPLGMMLMYHPGGVEFLGDAPWSPTLGASSVAEAQAGITELSAWWDHQSPLFLSVYMIAWETSPSDVVEIADSLGPDYVVVGADQYFQLIREAQLARPAPAFSVTASSSYEGSPPELAIDGDPSTAWNAGDYAPQWIEFDLGRPRSVDGISLLIAQSPKGETVHRVLGKAGPDAPYRILHRFIDVTSDGHWLSYSPPTPWEGIRFIRIETTRSPSWVAWREIRIQLVPAS